jgi:WD40 repeat protein
MDVLGAQPQRIHDGVSFSFSQDSSSYAVAYPAGSIERWDAAQDVRDQVLGGDPSGVSALTFTPDGGIISSSFDCQTYLWDASSGERSLQFEPAWGEGLTDHRLLRFDQLLLMRNQDVLIGNSRNGQSAIWNVSDGSVLRLSRESERFLAASSNGEFVALQREGSILLANGIDATNETHVAVDRSTLTAAAFSTDGSIFLTGERNYNLEAFSSTLKLFDASSGDLLALEELPAEEITAVAMTPDHHYVAVAYRDGTYQLFAVHELGG